MEHPVRRFGRLVPVRGFTKKGTSLILVETPERRHSVRLVSGKGSGSEACLHAPSIPFGPFHSLKVFIERQKSSFLDQGFACTLL